MSLIILKIPKNQHLPKAQAVHFGNNCTVQKPLHAWVRRARASCHNPCALRGQQKTCRRGRGSPVMKETDGGTWDLCTINFVRTERCCASLSLSIERRLSPLSLLKYSGFMNIEEVEQSVHVNLSFFWAIKKKKKKKFCYFSTSSVFPHEKNILELSAPPLHYFPDFSFFNTPKQEGRSRKQK